MFLSFAKLLEHDMTAVTIELEPEGLFEARKAIEAEIRGSERALSSEVMTNHQSPGGLADRCEHSIKVLRAILEKMPAC
jgi:hypothetical protein